MEAWLKERLSEKSTQTALVGLSIACLELINIPKDILYQLQGFLTAFLIQSAATKG